MYSEVAAHLANNTYRIQARRFLQELFLDSSFEKVSEKYYYVSSLNIVASMFKNL